MLEMPDYEDLFKIIKNSKDTSEANKIMEYKSLMIITLLFSMIFSKQLKDTGIHLDFKNLHT